MIRLSQFWEEFEKDPKERDCDGTEGLVRGLWLSGRPRSTQRSQTFAVPRRERTGSRIGVLSNGPPSVSMRSFAFRKAKEDVGTENLRLRATTTIPVFEDGGVRDVVRCCHTFRHI